MHKDYTEMWDPDLNEGEVNRRARRAEGRRVIWRGYQRKNAAWATVRLHSSLTAKPVEPTVEPLKLELLLWLLVQLLLVRARRAGWLVERLPMCWADC